MGNLLRPYDKEYMRMAILKHEETFKEQVYELHRLYRIQKTLMKSMGSSRPKGNFSLKNNYHHGNINMHQNTRTRLDLEHPAAEGDHRSNNVVAEPDYGRNTILESIDESEIELTLGPTRYVPRKKHGTPRTSDSGPSFSSSSTESSHVKKTSTTGEDFTGNEQMGLFKVTDMTFGYPNGSKNNTDLEEQLRQERLKQPPWLFQVLSMNMT
ncbi:hypothetical protein Gotri_018926 [Gossypium trilobum]|uniref:Uncharacterized protein n=1 Tax=Gossypium trilobum TaxID=34281 RepID=A0A7J9EBQ8_9ROSI|nr:hypothetical protein [Gossypium trilobum]